MARGPRGRPGGDRAELIARSHRDTKEGWVVPVQRENSSPWLTVRQAAQRAQCGVKLIYREVAAGRLRAARVGGRRELRLLPDWVDEWLFATSTVIEVR